MTSGEMAARHEGIASTFERSNAARPGVITAPNAPSLPASTPPTWPLAPVSRMRMFNTLGLRCVKRQLGDVRQGQAGEIALRKLRLADKPVDAERRIVPAQYDLVVRTVE